MNFEIKVVIKASGECEVVHVENEKVIGYELKEGDVVVDLGNYNDFLKPKWNGNSWIEGVTQEELDEHNIQPKQLTEVEKLRLEQAQSNVEMIELLMSLQGGI